jgi:hypothetical protein
MLSELQLYYLGVSVICSTFPKLNMCAAVILHVHRCYLSQILRQIYVKHNFVTCASDIPTAAMLYDKFTQCSIQTTLAVAEYATRGNHRHDNCYRYVLVTFSVLPLHLEFVWPGACQPALSSHALHGCSTDWYPQSWIPSNPRLPPTTESLFVSTLG